MVTVPIKSPEDGLKWLESVLMRRRAFGPAYWPYAVRAVFWYGLVWGALFSVLVLAGWIVGHRPWLDANSLSVVVFATFCGAFIRMLIECMWREIGIRDTVIVIYHTGWTRVRRIDMRSCQNVSVARVAEGLARITAFDPKSRRRMIVAVPDQHMPRILQLLESIFPGGITGRSDWPGETEG